MTFLSYPASSTIGAGRIIASGGPNINSIRDLSGAHIEVEDQSRAKGAESSGFRSPSSSRAQDRGAVTAALTKATFKPSWNGPDSSSLSQLTYSDLFQVIIYSRVYFYINIFSFHRSSLQSVLVADNIFEEENIKDFNIPLNQVASNLERLEYLKPRRGKMLLKNKNVDEFIKLYK